MSGLSIWTVYDHPKDYPNSYVARRWEGVEPTFDMLLDDHIDVLRIRLQRMGLVKLMRHPGDDPVIMETWI